MKPTIQYLSFTIATIGSLAIATQIGMSPSIAQSMKGHAMKDHAMMQAKSALADELQGKPVVVDIYASWCGSCKSIAPTLSKVKQQYGGKIHYIVFDVSDRGSTKSAQARAKQLGLSSFLEKNQSQTSLVAIINPATGEVMQEFRANPKLKDYQTALNQALKQVK